MKILVTGTAGFIGFHLAKRLLERGDTVVGIDNTHPVKFAKRPLFHRGKSEIRTVSRNRD